MKTVYITGATGFIGHHLVRANLAAGNRVRALVLANDPGAASLRGEGVEVVAGEAGASRVCRLRVGSVEVSFDALPEAGYVASLVRALGE